MATSRTTTTLRVPLELRDEIARIAEQRGTTMLEVVTHAVQQLGRDEWWASVRGALDNLSANEVAEYRAGAERLQGATSDGLDDR